MFASNDNSPINSAISSYNDDVREAHYQSIHRVEAWSGNTRRPLMSDVLAEAANDNSPTRAA